MDVNRAARIAAAAHGGQVLASDATRALVVGSLPDGVELRDVGSHRLKGLPDRERLHQLVIAGLASDFSPVRSLDVPLGNVPARVTTFVGREREIEEVMSLLREARMVTLLGPGGTGKTALATEVARRIAAEFADGVWFAPLEALADHRLVASAIVSALGLRDVSGRSARERVLDNLPGRSVLLVLDNFEHVVDAAPLIGEILAAAPNVKALVTSRAPLHLGAEQLFLVSPLGTPAPADIDPDALSSIPSVRLFVERARRVQPGFALTAANGAAIAEICRQLDGLPLGIELAAARIALLGPAGILQRLERHAPLGGHTTRDRPSRQRTLEDTIAWSHDLLDERGRTLFAGLSVFVGGWRLEQAEQVCGPDEDRATEVAETLERLVDQSLVTAHPRDDGVRFGMLETVRRDASRRLDPTQTLELRRRHADAYLRFAQAFAPRLETSESTAALAGMAEERDNLRAAVRFAVEAGDAALGLAFAQPLGTFFVLSGDMDEATTTIDAILAIPRGEAPSLARMRALEAAGTTAYYGGDRERPRHMYRAQLEMAQALGDRKGIADARWNLFFTVFGPRDWEPALRELDEIEAAYRELGDERALARTMWARSTRLAAARRRTEAIEVLEVAIERYRALGDLSYQSQAATLLTALNLELGDASTAARWLLEALGLADEARSAAIVMTGLPMTALVIARLGMPEDAATIFGAYEGLTRRWGIRMPRFLEELMSSRFPMSEITDALPRATYDAARRRGDGMQVQEVLAYARQLVAERGALPR
jgi:predicted ATPase